MRISIIIMISFLISSTLIGQETKLVTKYFHNSKQIMEEYYVQTTDANIKHGEYIQYYRTSNKDNDKYISKRGFYYNNQLDSIWIYYGFRPGYSLITKEEIYKRGKKVGIWKTYIESGSVIKRFDYDLNKEIEPEIRAFISYPAMALDKEIDGIVKIQVIYNNDCSINKMTVLQSANPVLNNDAMKYVSDVEKLRLKYSLIKDCSVIKDSTYTVRFKLYD